MSSADITNRGLGKIVSLEFIGMIVICAIAWGTLTATVVGLGDDVKTVQADRKSDSDEIKGILITLKEIQTDQKHFRTKLNEQSTSQKEALDILRELSKGG
tara:strand:- start:751 stop:1053 length:303 start_codon:yes stop_codon:yes gene_type:complete